MAAQSSSYVRRWADAEEDRMAHFSGDQGVASLFFLVSWFIGGDRPFTREVGAQAELRTLHAAEARYHSMTRRYTGSLRELGSFTYTSSELDGEHLIPASLANGVRRGYPYTLRRSATGYEINASPVVYGASGSQTFYTNESETIHVHQGPEPATAHDPVLE